MGNGESPAQFRNCKFFTCTCIYEHIYKCACKIKVCWNEVHTCKYERKGSGRLSVCFMCMHLNIYAFMSIHSRESKLKRKYRSQVYKGRKKITALGKWMCLLWVKHWIPYRKPVHREGTGHQANVLEKKPNRKVMCKWKRSKFNRRHSCFQTRVNKAAIRWRHCGDAWVDVVGLFHFSQDLNQCYLKWLCGFYNSKKQ